jgi:hypothetical protein
MSGQTNKIKSLKKTSAINFNIFTAQTLITLIYLSTCTSKSVAKTVLQYVTHYCHLDY